jgi:hypothetical protein
MATKVTLKGVYKLNPTKAVMKTGSNAARKAVTSDVKSFKKVKPPKAIKGKQK